MRFRRSNEIGIYCFRAGGTFGDLTVGLISRIFIYFKLLPLKHLTMHRQQIKELGNWILTELM